MNALRRIITSLENLMPRYDDNIGGLEAKLEPTLMSQSGGDLFYPTEPRKVALIKEDSILQKKSVFSKPIEPELDFCELRVANLSQSVPKEPILPTIQTYFDSSSELYSRLAPRIECKQPQQQRLF